jgi:hypothetical protein
LLEFGLAPTRDRNPRTIARQTLRGLPPNAGGTPGDPRNLPV